MVAEGVFDIVELLAEVAIVQRFRLGIAQVPGETVESCMFRERRRRLEPVVGNVGGSGIDGRRHVGKFAHQLILRIVDGKFDAPGHGNFQEIIDDRAVGRIGRGGFFGRKRRVLISVPANSHRRLRMQQCDIGLQEFVVELANR